MRAFEAEGASATLCACITQFIRVVAQVFWCHNKISECSLKIDNVTIGEI